MMGMKETHIMPNNADARLKYMREETYFDGLAEKFEFNNGREIGLTDELQPFAYFIACTEMDEETNHLRSMVSVVPLYDQVQDDNNSKVAIDWLFEEIVPCEPCSIEFLMKLQYDSGENYYWRKKSWMTFKKYEKSLLNLTLGRWLFPSVKPTKLNLPNLMLRLSGEWNGWEKTASVEQGHKRYKDWEKNDAIEDEAFKIYKKIVHPLAPMKYIANPLFPIF